MTGKKAASAALRADYHGFGSRIVYALSTGDRLTCTSHLALYSCHLALYS
ncbi:hypothetical protein ACFPZI_18485 [Streptomyces chlorus]|uniref:Uncharacterized protein n=1 Tax=Streptomyces chlorus TaxID=887452 RepID=A0ABW1E1C7_9ACTN